MYKTIIMPVDVFEMELSDKAVRHAEFLAQDDGVIHLLHVLPGSASLSLHRFAADVRRFEEHLQHEAQERLQTMVSHFTIDPSRIKQHVRFGSVRDEVNELAEELGADVVVIGSRNPSISTHLLGSNASKRDPPRQSAGAGCALIARISIPPCPEPSRRGFLMP